MEEEKNENSTKLSSQNGDDGGRGRKVQTNEKEHVGQERKDSSENIVGSSKSK